MKSATMFLPKIKSLIFRFLYALFVPDCRKIYRQHIEARMTQRQMKYLLREVSLNDLRKARLIHLAERMDNLQKLIYLIITEVTNDKISYNQNRFLNKIQKHIDLIEKELLRLHRYINTK